MKFKYFDLKDFVNRNEFSLYRFDDFDMPRMDYREKLKANTIYDPDFYLIEMKNVFVKQGDFVIFDHNGGFLCDGLVFNDVEKKLKVSGSVELATDELNSAREFDDGFLIGDNNNYYHWLINYAPRYMLYERFRCSFPLVLTKSHNSFIDMSLSILGHNHHNVIELDRNEVVSFKKLLVPCFFQNPMQSPTGISYIREKLGCPSFGKDEKRRLSKRIYVSRNDGGNRRQVVNEEEVIDLLRKYDFDVIVPSYISLREQIQIFNDASFVVSPHGAALTNLIFSRLGTSVIEFQSKEFFTRVFWELGKFRKANSYDILSCDAETDDTRHRNHKNLVVDMQSLNKLVKTKLKK